MACLPPNADADGGGRVTIVDLDAPPPLLRRRLVCRLLLPFAEEVPRHADKIAEATGSPLDSDASIAHERRI